MKMKVNNVEETISLGVKIGELLKKGDILLLEGDLGAGKTTFTKGIANGLGITGYVKSPTFTYVIEYQDQGPIALYHFDLYRLNQPEELYDLGFEDFIDQGVLVMEWGGIVEDLLVDDGIEFIKISFAKNEEEKREIEIADTLKGKELYKELTK